MFKDVRLRMRMESIVDEKEFIKHHQAQVESRSQKDVFFIWMLIIFISVIAAHLVLNFTGSSPTGFVTAATNPTDNSVLLFGALLVVFIVILITALIYIGITKNDY